MSIELNHAIVWATEREASAGFLGIPLGPVAGPFRQVQVANGVTLDFANADEVQTQHYAFLVGDDEFDAAIARLKESRSTYWADPFHRQPGEINHMNGGRGVYFTDPDGTTWNCLREPEGGDHAVQHRHHGLLVAGRTHRRAHAGRRGGGGHRPRHGVGP
jgi:hypothetical protein